jgi:hypothetical protein
MDQNLDRVTRSIGDTIVDFCIARKNINQPQFHMAELTKFVADDGHSIAPDSAGRVLRSLRQDGLIAYTLKSRRDSLYELA